MIRDANKEKECVFCMRMVDNNEDFADCVFTDESTAQREGVLSTADIKSEALNEVAPYGGISIRGATELAVFPGEMRLNSQGYCKILERCFVRFKNSAHQAYGKLMRDNAPVHKSAYTTAKLDSWNVEVVDWPPESPDLNPIELRRRAQVGNVAQLRDAIFAFWKALTPNVWAKYTKGIPRRMERVIEQNGQNIKELSEFVFTDNRLSNIVHLIVII
ncbi:hypothetical protein ANCDUO_02791 [Ancylostoma duodenale]|uniref:Tc1-like transposase DDE domain-containing protein n=1 Tax=Ancylostoma duodenale TaxID=51022 RepID=A0A0C2HBM8_9BILA|nr:hypothetical protein ANCDUO_02791 [Ancylostoma duodenale]